MVTTGPRRAAQDRRQQIVDAATELFALQGFRGTTTRQIADTARVNEAIIFRHFGRKEDLYRAVIERECLAGGKGTPPWKELRGRNGARGDVGTVFATIAEEMLRRHSDDSTITRLLLFSALERRISPARESELIGFRIASLELMSVITANAWRTAFASKARTVFFALLLHTWELAPFWVW